MKCILTTILVALCAINIYAKPSAPVDIVYETAKAQANEDINVSVEFITYVESGVMSIDIILDKGLEETSNIGDNLTFNIKTGKTKYPLNMKVKASEDGLYYVNFIISLNDEIKTLSIPVYVGNWREIVRSRKGNVANSSEGEQIIILKGLKVREIE